MDMSDPPRTPPSVVVLTVVAALGVCAIAAAAMVPALLGGLGAWPVLVAGLLLLIAALAALWVIQRRRDRTLW
jgi:protein-S-isoprenylcysteine O-methyltransferase Ste14